MNRPTIRDLPRPPTDCRLAFNAILWIVRTGSPWRDLPEDYGKWRTIYGLYDKWNADGTLDAILGRLRSVPIDGEAIVNDLWCIDGTVTRAHRYAAGGGKQSDSNEPADHALGRSRDGLSIKFHLLVDSFGHLLAFVITGGQVHETTAVELVLKEADVNLHDGDGNLLAWPVNMAGDKGYQAAWIDDLIKQLGINPVIPSKANEDRDARAFEFNRERYRRRNMFERATRLTESTVANYSLPQYAASMIEALPEIARVIKQHQLAVIDRRSLNRQIHWVESRRIALSCRESLHRQIHSVCWSNRCCRFFHQTRWVYWTLRCCSFFRQRRWVGWSRRYCSSGLQKRLACW